MQTVPNLQTERRTPAARPVDCGVPILVNGVSKRYKSVTALDALDLEVRPGDMYGFLGPNGSGKTTAIRILLGFVRPSGGRARVFGLDPWKSPAASWRQVGYLPGELGFYDEMRGIDFLGHLGAFSGVDIDYRARVLDRLGLGEKELGRRIGQYSKGMKQKLALVQCMQHRPRLLILDEPTSGLDPLVQTALFEVLNGARADGATVFFSSHVLSEVEEHCDRVGLIRAGRLIAESSMADLRRSAARRVRLRFSGTAPDGLDRVPGVIELRRSDPTWSFKVQGDLGPLIKAIAGYGVADIVIEPVSLEDVFFSLYQDERR